MYVTREKETRHRRAMVSQTQESLNASCTECHGTSPRADFLIRVSLGGTGTKREKAKRTFRSPARTGRMWSSGSIAAGFTQERPAGSALDHPTLSKVREFNPMAASDHAYRSRNKNECDWLDNRPRSDSSSPGKNTEETLRSLAV